MSQRPTPCGDCVTGIVGRRKVTASEWDLAAVEFDAEIERWNEKTKRHEVPHPGFCIPFNYCPNCGRSIKRQ